MGATLHGAIITPGRERTFHGKKYHGGRANALLGSPVLRERLVGHGGAHGRRPLGGGADAAALVGPVGPGAVSHRVDG